MGRFRALFLEGEAEAAHFKEYCSVVEVDSVLLYKQRVALLAVIVLADLLYWMLEMIASD